MRAHEILIEGVAGPKNCWPGYRKTGTQPGTGKNAGKRVNDCEKIKEDEVEESGLQYYTGVKKHGKEYMTKAAQAARNGASQKELGALKDKYSKAHKNEEIEEAAKKGLYYYVNKRKKAGTSRDASSPKAPTAQAWKDAAKTAKKEELELEQEFDIIESIIEEIADRHAIDVDLVWEDLSDLTDDELYVFAVTSEIVNEDWQKANKRDKTDGMSKKAVNAYRRENPGSKLKTAVTTKPSKLKRGSKASKRRKSYCSRSRGQMSMHNISCAKTPDKAICKARRRWNC
jgi:hypothetical protein